MRRPIIFMFSGEGSQYYQMGRELFTMNAGFRRRLLHLDRIATGVMGCSVLSAIYDDRRSKADPLAYTQVTHPAIFMLGCALAETLMEEGIAPTAFLGTSLGLLIAAAVSGCIEQEAALVAVIRQAQVFETTCPPGTMLAVLASAALWNEIPELRSSSEIAAINFNTHFAISALDENVPSIEAALRTHSVDHQRVVVSRAFHSQWIDGARGALIDVMANLQYRASRAPLICCASAETRTELSAEHMWRVARQPILFRDTIALIEQEGACDYVDVGAAGTLATFVKYNMQHGSRSRVYAVMTPYGRDVQSFAATSASLRGS